MLQYIFNKAICIFILTVICLSQSIHAEHSTEPDSIMIALYKRCKTNIKHPVALEICDTLCLLAKQSNNKHMKIIALCAKLDYFYYQNDKENILKYVEKVKQKSREYNELKYYYFAWGDRLITYYLKQNQINTAMYETEKMLKAAQNDNYPKGLATCYHSLANIYITQENNALAYENFRREIDILEKNHMDDLNLPTEYAALSQCAIQIGRIDEAKAALNKALPLAKSIYQKFNVQKAYALLHIKTKELDKAQKAIQQMEKLADQQKDRSINNNAYRNVLTQYYCATKQYQAALETIHQIAQDSLGNASEGLNYILTKRQGDIYWEMNNMPQSARFYRDYIQSTDSIRNITIQNSANEIASLLGIERLENEKNQLLLHIQKEELLVNRIAVLSLSILLITGGVFFMRTYKLNKKLRNSENTVTRQYHKLKEKEKELCIAKERAENASMMKTTFIQNMSHEIRTPLNSIVGFSQVLTSYFKEDNETKEFASIIETSSVNLLRLINDVLDISYLDESEKLEYSTTSDINDSCLISIEQAQSSVKPGINLIFHPERDSLMIKTNPDRVSQVLTHLLLNAAKFTTEGSISLTYSLTQDNKYIKYTVEDTVKGIPVEKQEFVFQRFAKLDNVSQGTGLGLSICRIIAEKMRGNLTIDKEYIQGCRFIFTLPLILAE